MPAEWEPHRATWISWPHHEPDWPGKLAAIPWVYAEITRLLADAEDVEVLCHSEEIREQARAALTAHHVRVDRVRLHVVPSDRVWLRDSAPIGVLDAEGRVVLLRWAFNAWAKYPNWQLDAGIGRALAHHGLPAVEPTFPPGERRIVLEGGGIDVDGQGTVLVTEEWLLSDTQIRNPGLTREHYERVFRDWLGHRERSGSAKAVWVTTRTDMSTTWRVSSRRTRSPLPSSPIPQDENHERSMDNLSRLEHASGGNGARSLRIVQLPFPRPVMMNGERLPASYANFYIANGVVLVPTFNDPNDRSALNRLSEAMPDRRVVGVHAVDLVWGLGTLHCLTQQQPLGRRV